jgi:hypothetical protein
MPDSETLLTSRPSRFCLAIADARLVLVSSQRLAALNGVPPERDNVIRPDFRARPRNANPEPPEAA